MKAAAELEADLETGSVEAAVVVGDEGTVERELCDYAEVRSYGYVGSFQRSCGH